MSPELPFDILADVPTRGPFSYLSGGFSVGNSRVPFFSITLSAEDARNFISLPREVPYSPEQPIELAELFQRELDEDRVRDGLLTYLKDPTQLRFMNSLTVALMPLEKVGEHSAIAQTYSEDTDAAPSINYPGLSFHRKVGAIAISAPTEHHTSGLIAWNPEYTLPVVLDGQHRLFAIREALTDLAFPGRTALQSARLSVLILVLDERAGYQSPVERTVLEACRKVFTDLNKHAKQVDKARQYLLDDTDLVARSLRECLEPEVPGAALQPPAERAISDARLPLAFIDWRGEEAKFDGRSVYLSTILALHPVVQHMLALRPFGPEDYDRAEQYVRSATSRLLSGEARATLEEEVLSRLQNAAERELPFSFSPLEVGQLARGFQRRFGRRIVAPLVMLAPYKRLIEAFSEEGWLASERESWFSLDDDGRTRLEEQLELPSPARRLELVAEGVKENHLAFQVVFQRAILLAVHSLVSLRESVGVYWFASTDASEQEVIDEFVARWDARLDGVLGDGPSLTSPLVGAGLRAGGGIDYRKTRVESIAAMMSFVVLFPLDSVDSGDLDDEVNDFVSAGFSGEQEASERFVSIASLLTYHAHRWKRSLRDLLRAREEDVSDAAVAELARRQLTQILQYR